MRYGCRMFPRVLLGSLGCVLALGCTEERKGQLLLSVGTDMAAPDNFDSLVIEVLFDGTLQSRYFTEVGPGGTLLPGTFGVIAGEQQGSVNVRVASRATQDGQRLWQTHRDVITTVPPAGRIAVLHVPVQWLCTEGDGAIQNPLQEGFEEDLGLLTTNCPDPGNQTCVAGTCVERTVAVEDLPEFSDQEIFGDGTCFDTLACFEGSTSVEEASIDTENCELSNIDVNDLNVGLAVERPGGICPSGNSGSGECIVPLDKDDGAGWKESGDRVLLPRAVCDRLADADSGLQGVRLTNSCSTKSRSNPVCGEWAAVPADGSGAAQ